MKNWKYRWIPAGLLFTLLHFSCKEVFEKSLTDENVVLSGPADQLTTDSSRQSFFWQPMDPGTNYELQIVTPGFDSVAFLIADTTTQTSVLYLSLDPGEYQWRVRAFNASSSTVFCKPRTLTIH